MENKILYTSSLTGDRIKKYLEEGKRFDGRKADEFRDITIEIGVSKKAEGSAKVKVGKTEIIAGVKLDVGTPYADSANKGNLITSAELLPLSSPRFESGPPKFEAIELARVIDRGIRESKFIDFEKLCIKEGEKVWNVYIDIYTLNNDGNLIDAGMLAAVAALKSAKMPIYDEKTERVQFGERTKEPVPLSKDMPVSVTLYKLGKNYVVDPCLEEEDITNTRVTVGLCGGHIASMQKGLTATISSEEFAKMLDTAEKVGEKIFKTVEKQLK